ncbi:prephenate dehydratase [Sporolactobacillus putidus]|uniref:Prephenate dehydratase n=1 Tax=Sporolactobacillus putidus TaxID=492735 RepID=A0A917W5Q7_9BACL|nr:prephenate dehydratase [Sporolactobacillus putidus]GGL65451.1 chorismate mutase [Sporolactobacillus putidus]
MKVAYLGPSGTFSEEAAVRLFSDADTFLPQESMDDVLQAVSCADVDKGVVPIENSIAGTIDTSIDGLLTYRLFIEADVIFPISLNLIGTDHCSLDTIRRVVSITPALEQCRALIRDKGWACDRVGSTAIAAKVVMERNQPECAAIASKCVADIYGLKLIASDIQDNKRNHTRFIIISRNSHLHQHQKKTMLLVTPATEHVGMLASILNVFATLSINLSWIESRPTGEKLGEYRFFIETEAGYGSDPMNKAIMILRTFGHEVDILGSYSTKII